MKGIWVRGISTDPDLMKLEEKVGVPKEGDTIPYEVIEEAIGCDRMSSRFRSVTIRWRKKLLRERNIHIVAIRDTGLRVNLAHQRVEHVESEIRGAGGKLRRAWELGARTEKGDLTQAQSRKLDCLQGLAAALIHQGGQELKSWENSVKQPERIRGGTTSE